MSVQCIVLFFSFLSFSFVFGSTQYFDWVHKNFLLEEKLQVRCSVPQGIFQKQLMPDHSGIATSEDAGNLP